jgi:cytochrome c5
MSGKVLTAALIAAGLLCAGLPVHPAQAKGMDSKAKALFEAKCSVCHSLSRPLGKTMDLAGWTKTVTRMQKVNGCPITDQEAKTIIDYLVAVRGPSKK